MDDASISAIMDFYVWPYGNAQESKNADGSWKYTCQHGTPECIGNMWEVCAINHYNTSTSANVPTWWPFFYCMEKDNKAGVESVAQSCASSNGLDWSVISTCTGPNTDGNDYGYPSNALMHDVAIQTNNLQPPHQWTPWVVLNGKPLSQAQLDMSLMTLVCQAYTGPTPAGCKKMSEKLSLRN